jgi:hypothetical protein
MGTVPLDDNALWWVDNPLDNVEVLGGFTTVRANYHRTLGQNSGEVADAGEREGDITRDTMTQTFYDAICALPPIRDTVLKQHQEIAEIIARGQCRPAEEQERLIKLWLAAHRVDSLKEIGEHVEVSIRDFVMMAGTVPFRLRVLRQRTPMIPGSAAVGFSLSGDERVDIVIHGMYRADLRRQSTAQIQRVIVADIERRLGDELDAVLRDAEPLGALWHGV